MAARTFRAGRSLRIAWATLVVLMVGVALPAALTRGFPVVLVVVAMAAWPVSLYSVWNQTVSVDEHAMVSRQWPVTRRFTWSDVAGHRRHGFGRRRLVLDLHDGRRFALPSVEPHEELQAEIERRIGGR